MKIVIVEIKEVELTNISEETFNTLVELEKNNAFNTMLKWGLVDLRVESYEVDDESGNYIEQKIVNNINDAKEFLYDWGDKLDVFAYVDGQECECLNVWDLA